MFFTHLCFHLKTPSNSRTIWCRFIGRKMNNIPKRTRKHTSAAWLTSTYQPSIYLEMRNTMKTICNDSNGAPSEYKSEALCLQPLCSVAFIVKTAQQQCSSTIIPTETPKGCLRSTKFNTRCKHRQYFCAQFVMSTLIQSNPKDYEWLPIYIPAVGSASYKITVSLHHTCTLISLQQPL